MMDYYLVQMQDVTPVLHGPYKTEATRDKAARKLRAADKHEIFKLDTVPILPGARVHPSIKAYRADELEAA